MNKSSLATRPLYPNEMAIITPLFAVQGDRIYILNATSRLIKLSVSTSSWLLPSIFKILYMYAGTMTQKAV
ncbi:hypothetical protein AF332_08940 [Sporosarcina globispora]|uniref:Uncharacterized protein n=1 Tax=Sporosarcina globispora TaxID=1459 RepID=A0A0M0GBW8_SPOGL|nr:hypothetical protein AF332_08940 [Sporosarcina globispora]